MSAPTMAGLFTPLLGGMVSVNPYERCDHRCRYCVTHAQGRSVPAMSIDDAVAGARRQIERADDQTLFAFSLSDPYPPPEAEAGLTRALLETFTASDARFVVVTKGDVVLRDIDLFLAAGDRAQVTVSVASTDDEALAVLDPGAPSPTRRFEVLDELHRAGVNVDVNALPWIPGITDAGAIIERVPDDVSICFGPLTFGVERSEMTLAGRTYARDEVWSAYYEAYRAHGHHPNTSWVRPSLTELGENLPYARLPVLAAT